MKLAVATEEQKRARDPLAWAEWGSRLTLEQFAERERRLRGHPWSREVMQTWLWLGANGEVLSSCETFRMRSLLTTPGGREEGVCFGVASVLTEPALRGRGYAGAMMRALVARLREEPRAHASLLYSDVGPALYERAGYVAHPAADRVFSPGSDGSGIELFTERELPEVLARTPIPDVEFVVWPTAGQLDWHLERERVYATLLGEDRPTCCGARLGDSSAFWAADLKNRILRILLLVTEDRDEAVALLRAARAVAQASGLREVRLCEQPVCFEWPAGPDGGVLSDRDGELPMLAALDPRVRPETWTLAPRALWI